MKLDKSTNLETSTPVLQLEKFTITAYHKHMETHISDSTMGMPRQLCPRCEEVIGAFPGGRDATCKNCGFKDPCCE